MPEPAHESINAIELGQMRRELLRILDRVDPQPDQTRREDVCRRIQRLCRDGIIPETIAAFMHVVRICRNRAEYQDWRPRGFEALAIRFAWAAIDDWRFNSAQRAA